MAWTAPMTAVANATFTAAQFNTYVRDNLNETAPAKATTAGSIFVGTGANSIAERVPQNDVIATSQTTTSTSYTDLTTPGPAVTCTTAASAVVFVSCNMSNNSAGNTVLMGFDISGATTVAATTGQSLGFLSNAASDNFRGSWATIVTGLNSGSNTFTAKYRVGAAGTGSFSDRRLSVIPF